MVTGTTGTRGEDVVSPVEPEVERGHVVVTRHKMAAPPAVDRVHRRRVVQCPRVLVCCCNYYHNITVILLLPSLVFAPKII